jgi:acylphosphatase
MLVGRRFLVRGRVQGVGFRYFVQEAAAREGLRGWVRNMPDGRVEAEVEGDQDAANRFEARIRRGPSGARVDEVVAVDQPATGSAGLFEIR